MVLSYLQTKLSVLPRIFSPTVDAIFSTLPFWQRWRLLCLQPINIIAALLTSKSWFFNDQYKVISVPTRGGKQRCLIFEPKYSGRAKANLRPLHIDIHGGGWIGGMAEQGSRFCTLIANQTGAIVVSITYRIAPRHIYPAAHDDTNDVVRWIIQNAKELGADASMLTIGGSSVGATLALSACQMLHAQRSSPDAGKSCLPLAFMAVCPALDFRVRPREKPRPHNFPTTDPLSFLEPMFDVYAGTNRLENISDPRLHPILMDADMLPKDSMVVAAGIDIVLQEALEFVKRMKSSGRGKNIELFVVEKGFHGFLELPSFILEKERLEVFEKVIVFMDKVYLKAGFDKRDL